MPILLNSCGWWGKADAKNVGPQKLYVWIDKIILRELPKLGARELILLREGDVVISLGEMTDQLFRVELGGYEFEGSFIKVRTSNGLEGWVHEKAVREKPVHVRYRALIAFSSEEDVSEDWQGIYHDIHNLYINTPIKVSYVTEEFENVPIYNGEGEEVISVDIRQWVATYKRGYICLQAGKDPYAFPIASPNQMQVKIDTYFGRR